MSARKACIVGIGESEIGRQPGRRSVDLQAEAVIRALADAKIDRSDVGALFNLGPYSSVELMFALTLAEYLGILAPTIEASIDAGGTMSAMLMLANAVYAVESGRCDVAVCTFGEAALTGRAQAGRGWTAPGNNVEFERPFGIAGTVIPYAMLASRHMAEFGTTSEGLAAIAVSARKHAGMTDNAFRKDLISVSDVLASSMVASPLHLLDCSSMVDGAGAFVVTTRDRAVEASRCVDLLGWDSKVSHRNIGAFSSFQELEIGAVVARAFGPAGLTIADVDVALIHDAFTISTLVYLEELGFCLRGSGGDYALEGNLDLGSKCPVNTHGGLLSQGHVGGVLHVTEAVRQLRGEAFGRQVEAAEVALVAGCGGILGVNGVMVLGRAR